MAIAVTELHHGHRRVVTSPVANLAALGLQEPRNGVYLVARTYRGGQVLDLDAHFDRLERSAASLGVDLSCPRNELRRVLIETRDRLPATDHRFRVTAVLDAPVWYRVAVEVAHEVPEELRAHGVECAVHRGSLRADAPVKTTAWIHDRRQLAGGDTAYEHLLANDEGAIYEGATSNFYALIGSTLHTAGEGVLEGIARRIVLTVAHRLAPALTVEYRPPTVRELVGGHITEAFISSATRGIVPVRRIDNIEVPVPGVWTARLVEGYESWMGAHLEPLAVD